MPKLLDLFCGPGGAAAGYIAAGWEVTGVDLLPLAKWYPGRFVQADALTFPLEGFDAIHASPPCQRWAGGASWPRSQGHEYPDHLTPTLDRLALVGAPWVVENVPNSPIRAQLLLCGSMFGLPVLRHRYFAANWPMPLAPADCCDGNNRFNVYDSGPRRKGTDRTFCDAMGVTWAPTSATFDGHRRKVALEAIPPAYTEFIGRALLAQLPAVAEVA